MKAPDVIAMGLDEPLDGPPRLRCPTSGPIEPLACFSFSLDLPPVPCARPRTVRQPGRGVRTIMPARTVAYEWQIGMAARTARPANWSRRGRYRVEIIVRRARRAGDVDNFAKSVLDGLTGALWDNDSQVLALEVEIVDGAAPGVDVTVYGYERKPEHD